MTFISNIRTISKFKMLLEEIVPHLQLHSFMAPSTLNKLSINTATRIPLQSHGQNLKTSFRKISKILKPLLTISRINLERTSIINEKNSKTKYHTFNTSNQSW